MALMYGIGACGVLLIVAVSCSRVPQLDSLSFLKTLTCYAFVVNCVTAWFFKGISSTSQRCSALSQLFRLCVTLLVSTLGFHVILVLFGAPLMESSSETFYFSILLTFTSVLPFLLMVGPTVESWVYKSFQDCPEYYVLLTGVTALVGAWLGAFVIPLDWDRWWQVWPISCVLGNQGGYCFGLIISAVQILMSSGAKKVHKNV